MEFEGEGPREDLESILERWWKPLNSVADESEEQADGTDPELKKARKSKAAVKRKPPSTVRSNNDVSSFDAVTIANELKSGGNWSKYNTKIVVAPGRLYEKAAMVLQSSDEPLTSGEIAKVLEVLGVKADRGNLSNSLKDNLSNLITDSSRSSGKPKYKLTASAIKGFEDWLNKTDK
jgi:hypothetical protein